ncbi:family 78 glycoside hydrolase catalytic domain [Demequina sp. SYSU T00192]|uniref:alpha-L-rhamnosidase n=1 Tax=Demequina litoralis TaxID=3051660 RepID=A0ABT8G735_9MICO|nr:family 78 glycoside hydrolase catalytic domain [Demequina sp. SYSU T00192]MDN4474729.1 family 78 glycoside hydrolase catalytic domain [Demequina sp. SYSU T00192]
MTRVAGVRAELRADALGVADPAPRLSWRIDDAPAGAAQTAAEARMTRGGAAAVAGLGGDAQALVAWPFAPLASRERATVEVRALVAGEWTAWSEPLAVEGALYDEADWTEPLVVPSTAAAPETRGSHLLRAAFTLGTAPVSARLHLTAQGVMVASLNGEAVSDEHLAPGWTSYRHRVRSRVHDVTALLHAGENVLGAEVADGWFRGNIGFDGGLWDVYGPHVGLLAQLEVTDRAGRTRIVPLGEAWRTAPGPATAAGLYEGEAYDARLLPAGWASSGFDDSAWDRPELRPPASIEGRIEPAMNEPARPIETLAPRSVERRPDGRVRLDFGQNISGVLRIRVDAPRGHAVTLHHAEVLEDDALGTRPLRRATSVDTFISAGVPVTWTPRFTIHGFRYAELEGWPGELAADAVEAVVIHTDMERRGWFECSEPLLNRLHENTVWSMRDNFVDLPTDCPQRDERMGWTGDIQVFAPAAEFLYGADGVLASWLRDVAAEQGEDGWVPNFVPWVECGFPRSASAAWGDAAVVVPWVIHERRGDLGMLARQWPSMTAWVDHLALRVGPDDVVEGSMELGDWLDPVAPPEDPGAARTDRYLVASAYAARSARIVADTAALLGEEDARERYAGFADRVLEGTRRRWIDDLDGLADAPTGLALAIEFGLTRDDAQRRRAGDLLAAAVRAGGHRIPTGFVGTPIICDALASTGHLDDAYALLLQRELPSWLYPVTMGATTIWERWDSMLPDGSINPGDMTSFNHYALGAVVDFLHRQVAGLAPAAPGYRHVLIRPRPGGGLTWARARHVSPYGPIEVGWRLEGATMALDLELPAGVTGEVRLPDGTAATVGPGTHAYTSAITVEGATP